MTTAMATAMATANRKEEGGAQTLEQRMGEASGESSALRMGSANRTSLSTPLGVNPQPNHGLKGCAT